MAQRFGGKIVTDGLVLCLDAHDAKSYAGEPANNLNSDTNDYTGTSYSYFGEWTSDPTRLSKSYDSTIKTPIGTGATLIQESGTNGYHHLSRMGGSETGNHTISFYFKPVTSDINNLKIGMLGDSSPIITFDFTQSPATVTQTGSSISGKLALLAPLNNGWYFCAADFNGRSGGWVGSVGFNINAAYTGVLGSKKAYICGLNYNNKAYAVPSFDRSATNGWVDRSGNSNSGTLVNGADTGISHYREGEVIMPVSASYLDFDGSDDYITISSLLNQEAINGSTTKTIILWLKPDSHGPMMAFSTGQDGNNRIYYWTQYSLNTWRIGNYTSTSGHSTLPSAGTWFCTAIVINGLSVTGYLNGTQDYTGAYSAFTTHEYAVLGRHGTGSYYYDGKIGKVSVYNKALSAAEVLNNYNTAKPRFGL